MPSELQGRRSVSLVSEAAGCGCTMQGLSLRIPPGLHGLEVQEQTRLQTEEGCC